MNQEGHRKLISGEKTGLIAGMSRFILNVGSAVYTPIVGVRNFLYSKKLLSIRKVDVPVICIGNVTAGGTGKTPLVIWVHEQLVKKDIKCSILTRGYKAKKGKFSDEPAILTKSCPGAKVIVNPDRVAGAAKALSDSVTKPGALIMDDGFQHRRLSRDIDIVTIDATCPFGFNKLLPAGLLREPIGSLKRARGVVITRTDQVTEDELADIENTIRSINPEIAIARSIHEPTVAKLLGGKEISLEELKEKSVFAFCGIGNPQAFFKTIEGLGLNVAGTKIYNDHHVYTGEDITDIYEEARYLKADLVLSTQKDWTKTALLASTDDEIKFAFLAVKLKMISGEEGIIKLIEKVFEDNNS